MIPSSSSFFSLVVASTQTRLEMSEDLVHKSFIHSFTHSTPHLSIYPICSFTLPRPVCLFLFHPFHSMATIASEFCLCRCHSNSNSRRRDSRSTSVSNRLVSMSFVLFLSFPSFGIENLMPIRLSMPWTATHVTLRLIQFKLTSWGPQYFRQNDKLSRLSLTYGSNERTCLIYLNFQLLFTLIISHLVTNVSSLPNHHY